MQVHTGAEQEGCWRDTMLNKTHAHPTARYPKLPSSRLDSHLVKELPKRVQQRVVVLAAEDLADKSTTRG